MPCWFSHFFLFHLVEFVVHTERENLRKSMQLNKSNGNGSFSRPIIYFFGLICKPICYQTQSFYSLFIKICIIFNLSQPNIINIREYFSGIHAWDKIFGSITNLRWGFRKILNTAVYSTMITAKSRKNDAKENVCRNIRSNYISNEKKTSAGMVIKSRSIDRLNNKNNVYMN